MFEKGGQKRRSNKQSVTARRRFMAGDLDQRVCRLGRSFHTVQGDRKILEMPRLEAVWRLRNGLCLIGSDRRVRPYALSHDPRLRSVTECAVPVPHMELRGNGTLLLITEPSCQ